MSPSPRTVTIIGAGIVGLACAAALTRRGQRVTLIDRGEPGGACSAGNAGHIATQAVEPLASPATVRGGIRHLFGPHAPLTIRPRYAREALPWLLRFVAAATRFDAGVDALHSLQQRSLPAWLDLLDATVGRDLLETRGHLIVAESDQGVATLRDRIHHYERFDIDCRWREREAVCELAPGLADSVQGGLYFPGTAHVTDPRGLCTALADWLRAQGAGFIRDEVTAIDARDGGFALRGEDRMYECSDLLVCAGAWSRRLARDLGHRLPLDTERGYHVTVPGFRPGLQLPVASHERHTIMTPMRGGLRITGFVELGGLELPPAAARHRELARHLADLLPDAAQRQYSLWMGHRPSLPDHLPVISRCRKHPRAVLAFGHQHLGLTLAAVTASLVTDLLSGHRSDIDLLPFRAGRFETATQLP